MRRFSLKSRKSSYSSSSKDGSSATNESASNSSRPSLTDFDRRPSKSNFVSLPSRLKRSKNSRIEEEEGQSTPVHKQQSQTFGERFFDLPAEIQTSILAYLSISELLLLRETSKQCLAIFRANAATIARNILLTATEDGSDALCSMSFLLDLYPSTFASTTTDMYFLRMLRRTALIKRQLNVLLTFVQTRVYMLKINVHLDCQHFAPYRSGLYTRLYSCTGYIQHLLESIRHLIVHNHPTHSSPTSTIDCCSTCTRTLKSLIKTYPPDSLIDIHQLSTLLLQHLRAATRSPSSITIFERKLRGWSYGPPPEDHLSQLILFGGITEVSKIDEMQGSYGKRLSVVKSFSDLVAESVRINSIAFPDFYQTGYDPVMGASSASSSSKQSSGNKDKHRATTVPKQIYKDKHSDIRTALEAHVDGIPIRKSLHPRLDLLTEQMVQSLPRIEKILVGPETPLVRRILELKLVEHERELCAPYAWVQRVMVESYKPDAHEGDEEGEQMQDGGFSPAGPALQSHSQYQY